MDRQTIYPGSIPLETDLLNTNRNVLIALGKLAAATIGTATGVNGFPCTQTTVPSMAVTVGAGEIYSLQNLDNSAYSSLAADTTHQIVKQGILLDAVNLSCPAPATAGYSVVYLIQASYQDVDDTPVVLPYYNSANPALGFSGPGGSGSAQNTKRRGAVVLSAKAGTPATTGTQVAPAADSGYVGMWTVTVANGASTVVNANIALASGAPFLSSAYVRTTDFTGGNRSVAGNGYQKLPGGLILQWGTTSLLAGDSPGNAVSFPITFPTACFFVVGSASTNNSAGSGAAERYSIGLHDWNTTGFTVENDSYATTATWFAIGV